MTGRAEMTDDERRPFGRRADVNRELGDRRAEPATRRRPPPDRGEQCRGFGRYGDDRTTWDEPATSGPPPDRSTTVASGPVAAPTSIGPRSAAARRVSRRPSTPRRRRREAVTWCLADVLYTSLFLAPAIFFARCGDALLRRGCSYMHVFSPCLYGRVAHAFVMACCCWRLRGTIFLPFPWHWSPRLSHRARRPFSLWGTFL
jgi:hypothetical protein